MVFWVSSPNAAPKSSGSLATSRVWQTEVSDVSFGRKCFTVDFFFGEGGLVWYASPGRLCGGLPHAVIGPGGAGQHLSARETLPTSPEPSESARMIWISRVRIFPKFVDQPLTWLPF